MARRTNDHLLVSYLVGIAVNGMTNDCLIQIISDMPQHTRNMTRLKTNLLEIDSIPLSVKFALLAEKETWLMFMTPEHIEATIRYCIDDETFMKKLLSLSNDKEFLERNRKHFEDIYADVIAAFDMPYVEGYTALKNLDQNLAKQSEDYPLTTMLMPAISKIVSLKTRFETHNNAIRTAVEIYLVKAKTGKLPDKQPVSLPGNIFSGKDFDYEKTDNGFIL